MNGSWDTPKYCDEKPDGFRWGEFGQALSFLPPAPFSLSVSTWARRPQRRQGARLVHKRTVSGVSGKVCGAGKVTSSHWAVSLPRCGLTSSNLGLTPPRRRPRAALMLRVTDNQAGC